ncbi:MogA/MoaB family molybdenum cofactor biosynthesis protein [Desulfonatronovibrio hydrogenovorans]|uniref:MogA/MoaB family molybdenum cofactor biosynthesis protein n=1 Tax=Desulfonatronovibrio hydrogenovorans TaxID=53245 RepID=UPI000B23FA1A|nr:MogA/MoaB family molybdenum cofactor biosynthesis protein [Desulfonatronovibrio hydrogenovorans]
MSTGVISITARGSYVCDHDYLLGFQRPGPGPGGYCLDYSRIKALRAGTLLVADRPRFQVLDKFWSADQSDSGGIFLKLRSLDDFLIEKTIDLAMIKKAFSLAWITLSDKGARGQREDESGPLIRDMIGSSLELDLARGFMIPDDGDLLRSLLVHLALGAGYDLIITTGGTGLGPRDITPQATLKVMDQRLHGFEQAMTAHSLTITSHAAISRAVAGTLGQSMIINLPGSPKGVRENLAPIVPSLKHALKKLQGDPMDCATGS